MPSLGHTLAGAAPFWNMGFVGYLRTADGRLGQLAFGAGPHDNSSIQVEELDAELLKLAQERLELEGYKWNLQNSYIAEQEANMDLEFETYMEAIEHVCKSDQVVANVENSRQREYILEHFSIQRRGDRYTVVDLRPFHDSPEYQSVLHDATAISGLIRSRFAIRIRGMLFGPINP